MPRRRAEALLHQFNRLVRMKNQGPCGLRQGAQKTRLAGSLIGRPVVDFLGRDVAPDLGAGEVGRMFPAESPR